MIPAQQRTLDHSVRRLVQASWIIAALAAGVAAVSVWALVTGDETWDPLGPYPLQRLVRFEDGVAVISGELCSDERTDVLTTLRWQAFDRDTGAPIVGAVVTLATEVQQTREKGCVTFCENAGCDFPAFRNPIPDELVALEASLVRPHRWRVTGHEIPIRRDGTEGLRERIMSETVQLPG